MRHLAGLDISIKETSICIVDGIGQISLMVPTEPTAIIAVFGNRSFAWRDMSCCGTRSSAATSTRSVRT